jgi:hypothetical protein
MITPSAPVVAMLTSARTTTTDPESHCGTDADIGGAGMVEVRPLVPAG